MLFSRALRISLLASAIAATGASATEPLQYIFSFDFQYSKIALEHDGWGLGVAYERKLVDHLSLRSGLGHMVLWTGIEELNCMTVNLSVVAHYYLFGEDLDRLYLGLGSSVDFLEYFGSAADPGESTDSIVYLNTVIGWKAYVCSWLMLDLSAGYNFIVDGPNYFPDAKQYGKAGFQQAIKIKLML